MELLLQFLFPQAAQSLNWNASENLWQEATLSDTW